MDAAVAWNGHDEQALEERTQLREAIDRMGEETRNRLEELLLQTREDVLEIRNQGRTTAEAVQKLSDDLRRTTEKAAEIPLLAQRIQSLELEVGTIQARGWQLAWLVLSAVILAVIGSVLAQKAIG